MNELPRRGGRNRRAINQEHGAQAELMRAGALQLANVIRANAVGQQPPVNGHGPYAHMNGHGPYAHMNGHAPVMDNGNGDLVQGRGQALLRLAAAAPQAEAAAAAEGNPPNEDNPQQPRQPRNMQGLLRFALDATRAEDAPGPSELGPMAEDRRQYLEQVLRDMTGNTVEILDKAIKELSNREVIEKVKADEDVPMELMLAFNNVTEIIYDIDVANDFGRMGGFAVFPICFACEHQEVRCLAYNLLAELCQNNPRCQRYAVQGGLVEKLLEFAGTERGPALCKVIYALAAIVRNYYPAADLLYSRNGCQVLIDILQSEGNEERSLVKVMFLLKYLVQEHTNAREDLIQKGLIETVLSYLGKEVRDCTEYALEVLLILARDKVPSAMSKLNTPETIKVLTDHKEMPDMDQEYPEYNFCTSILEILSVGD